MELPYTYYDNEVKALVALAFGNSMGSSNLGPFKIITTYVDDDNQTKQYETIFSLTFVEPNASGTSEHYAEVMLSTSHATYKPNWTKYGVYKGPTSGWTGFLNSMLSNPQVATNLGNGYYSITSILADDTVHTEYFKKDEDDGHITVVSKSEVVPTSTTDTDDTEISEEELEEWKARDMSAYKDDIATKMSNFKKKLDKVHNRFNNNRAVYTMYFQLKIAGQILVDTTSPNWIENCLVSFTHKMNGSGQCNEFTLDLLFKPNDRNVQNIKMLEAKLIAACNIQTDNDSAVLKTIADICGNCQYVYGYADGGSELKSDTYYGRIIGYKCKIDNGNLRYTITGVGSLSATREIRLSTKDEYLTNPDGSEITNPLEYIERIFYHEFMSENSPYYGLFKIKFLNNCYKDGTTELNGYTLSSDYKQFSQKNIFQIISDILAATMTESQYNAMVGNDTSDDSDDSTTDDDTPKNINPNQKQVYGYYVDDVSLADAKYGTIVIYKLPSAQGDENDISDLKPHCDIKFNWFGPQIDGSNNLVISWDPQYDGAMLMCLGSTLAASSTSTIKYTMDSSGNIIKVRGLGAARLGTLETSNDAKVKVLVNSIQEYSNWSYVTQYPYKSTMKIMGVPCETPITGLIQINAIMGASYDGENEHHSSGIYMIMGRTDTISSSGFFTELELFKMVQGYDPEYTPLDYKEGYTNQQMRDHAYRDYVQFEVLYRDASVINDMTMADEYLRMKDKAYEYVTYYQSLIEQGKGDELAPVWNLIY